MRQSEDSEGSEAVICRCSLKCVFKKFRNIHRRTPVLESHYNKVKKKLQRSCFSVNIAKIPREFFFVEHLHWVLLKVKQNATKEECIAGSTLWCLSCQLIIATTTFLIFFNYMQYFFHSQLFLLSAYESNIP